jgi:hypothetical protein
VACSLLASFHLPLGGASRHHFELLDSNEAPTLIPIESRLEGGGGLAKSKNYKLKHTLQAGVSVRMNIKSGRERKTNQPRNKADDTVICFTEVRF